MLSYHLHLRVVRNTDQVCCTVEQELSEDSMIRESTEGLFLTMKFVSHSKRIPVHSYRLGTLLDPFVQNRLL